MAEVPDQAAPNVEPDVRGISVNSNPGQFGATIARATEQIGGTLTNIGAKYGQIAAQDATNTAQQKKNDILYGVPGRTVAGPNGEQVPDTGYFGLKGADAMKQRKSVLDQIDQIDKDARGNLYTLDSQKSYDDESRRWRFYASGQVEKHASDQQDKWVLDTNRTTSTMAQNSVAQDPLNLVVVAKALQDNRQAQVRMAQAQGDTDAQGAVLRADQEIALARIRALVVDNPKGAKDVFEANKKILGSMPNYDTLNHQVDEALVHRMIGQFSAPAATQAYRPTGSRAQTNIASNNPGNMKKPGSETEFQSFPTMQAGIDAVGAQIERYRARGQNTIASIVPIYAPPKENNTAAYIAAVAKQTGIGANQPLKDGDIAKLRDAMITHEQGGVTPTQLLARGNAPAPGTKLGDARAKMQKAGVDVGEPDHAQAAAAPAAPQNSYLDHVRAAATKEFPNNPDMVEAVVRGTEENVKRDSATATQAFERSTKDSLAFLAAGGDPNQVQVTPDQVRATIPGQQGELAAQELESALDYGKAVQKIATATPEQLGEIMREHQPQGPEGFEQSYGSYRALTQAVKARQDMLFGTSKTPADPSGYALNAFPDVSTAYRAASSKGAPPVQFQTYAQKTLAAQRTLGVDPARTRILPVADARADVAAITTGNPNGVLPFLRNLRQHTGSYWPQVYGDLSRAGLPPAYQALAVMSGGDGADVKNAETMAAALSRDSEQRMTKNAPMAEAMRGVKYDDKSGGQPVSVTDLVDKTLSRNSPLGDLRASYGIFGRAGARDFDGIYDAVRTTALYLYQTKNMPPADAADAAAAMVTDPFDFVQQPGHAPIRLPKGQSDNFQSATEWTLSHLDADQIAPLHSPETFAAAKKAGDATFEADAKRQAVEGAKSGWWLTVPGAHGEPVARLINAYTGAPVKLNKGGIVEIPMSRLQWLAQEAHKGGADVEKHFIAGHH